MYFHEANQMQQTQQPGQPVQQPVMTNQMQQYQQPMPQQMVQQPLQPQQTFPQQQMMMSQQPVQANFQQQPMMMPQQYGQVNFQQQPMMQPQYGYPQQQPYGAQQFAPGGMQPPNPNFAQQQDLQGDQQQQQTEKPVLSEKDKKKLEAEESKEKFKNLAKKVGIAGSIIGGMALLHKIHHSGGLLNSLGLGTLMGDAPDAGTPDPEPEPDKPEAESRPNVVEDVAKTKSAPMEGPPPQEHINQRVPVYRQHLPQPVMRRSIMVPYRGSPRIWNYGGGGSFWGIGPRRPF